MNRLWLWISVVIGCVVLFVALLPFVSRTITKRAGLPPRPEERIPFQERDPEFRAMIEERAWSGLYRTLAVGAVFVLVAGVLLARWLVAPLRQLECGARAIANRQWETRVPVQGSAEMRSVALSFNQMAAELERQETLRRNMLADVTHELRHPVHILQGNLRAVLDGVYALDMGEIDRLLEQTQNLTALVDDLHELALAEARELPLHRQDTDLVVVVANITEIFQPLAGDKTITLKTDLPSMSVCTQVDPSRIRQALQNLLSNALRYTPEGGEINVTLAHSDSFALISVGDTGIGIAPENLSRVFDRFYRQDSSRNRGLPGTGLGLAIAQAIVQAHGGQIDVQSPGIDQGSTFTIRLPIDTK